MKTNRLYILLLLIAAPLFVACSSDDEEDSDDSGIATQFTPSEESATYFITGIDFDANSGEQAVTFTTNKQWTASSTESWCSVTPYGSSSDGTMTIKVSENVSYKNREAVITLKTGELNSYITVRQGGSGTAKIHLDSPGTLEQQLCGDDCLNPWLAMSNIKELTITGELNGTDFKFLHLYMSYSLEKIDISGARIVSGGDSYATVTEEYYTETDKVTDWLFCNFHKVKSIKLPTSITSIGEGAFAGCGELISMDIPQGVTSVGEYAFGDCINLNSINIPETVTKIDRQAFQYCSHLAKIKLPESVTKLSYGLFLNCSNLKDITYSSKLDSIEENVFSYCSSLEKIIIPKSVKYMENAWREGCTNLKTIEYHSEKIWYAYNSNCHNVSNIIIGDEVKEIEELAFYGYDSLRTLTIPANVKKLENGIIEECNIETLYMEATTPPETNGCLIYVMENLHEIDVMGTCTLYVPKGAKAAYQKVGYPWTGFKEIVEY